ncbi:MAG TPA: ribonuclease P protein component [Stellaceae bacterium]|nr:ribonuclease P protein component [Stellaceae bacterium]
MAAVARLKRRPEFLAVAASRRRWVAPGLILQAARRPEDSDLPPAPRIGFTASRKVGIAVARNRARRRLKAAAEQVLPVHGAAGVDYVAVARTATITRPFADLIADFTTAMKRLNDQPRPLSPRGEGQPVRSLSRSNPEGPIAESDWPGCR